MNKSVEIFISFARIGALTFGGGYAMIPILRKEVIDIKGWINEESMMDAYAIAQVSRSEERRGGQDCRSRGSADD